MIDFFRNKFFSGEGTKAKKQLKYEQDEKKKNTINEVQILEGHQDIVRLLIQIDESRIASAADDGSIFIWNQTTGECVMKLNGHTLAVTTMILLERDTLVSGSADKTIRIWDLHNGECVKILKGHEGSVRSIIPLDSQRFCSGSNDKYLRIWNYEGELLHTIERQEDENLHCMLPISQNRLVTGSNSILLMVYKTDTYSYHKVLAYHRDSVRCLVRVSASYFASASLDGAVVVWNSEGLFPYKILIYPEKYKDDSRKYIHNVKYLLPLAERYLCAAISCGFKIFEVNSGDCVLECKDVHLAEVNALLALYDGARIVSCGADGSIKLWSTNQTGFSFKRKFPTTSTTTANGSSGNGNGGKVESKSVRLQPVLVGEMAVHSDSVNGIIMMSETSFASCSSDQMVILWKDGQIESEYRNRVAGIYQEHHKHDKSYFTFDAASSPSLLFEDESEPQLYSQDATLASSASAALLGSGSQNPHSHSHAYSHSHAHAHPPDPPTTLTTRSAPSSPGCERTRSLDNNSEDDIFYSDEDPPSTVLGTTLSVTGNPPTSPSPSSTSLPPSS